MALNLRAGVLTGLLCCAILRGGWAQSSGLDPDRELPSWMRAWSALNLKSDLPRRLPGAGAATSAFRFGAPRVGTFWTAGNPAGLVEGIPDARSDFAAGWSRQHGDYRRLLDPGTAQLAQGRAQSWKGLSPTFALLGQVVFDQERMDPGTDADATAPFGSSPLATVDTSGTGLRRTRAVLEGVAGWKLGPWGVGVTLGFEARDHSSILSGVTRRIRSAMPALVLGATRKLGTVELGVHGRYRHRAEEIRVFERSENARVYQLAGYGEAVGIDLIEPYFRRTEENASAFGASLGGSSGGMTWTASAEATRLTTRLWRQRINDPDQDHWDAHGFEARGAVQRPLGARSLLTVHARLVSLSGEADLVTDSTGVIFTADESLAELEAEFRLLPRPGSWSGAVTLGMARESRTRRDITATLGTDISATAPSLAVEVGRELGARMFVAVGGALALYGPTSALPDPDNRGPVYQKYSAGELDLYASRATPVAISLLLQYRVGKGATLWLNGRTERLSSSESVPLSSFAPGGSRTATSIGGGVTLR